jgi:hypothetical protein
MVTKPLATGLLIIAAVTQSAASSIQQVLFVVGFVVRWEGAPWWAAALAAAALGPCARYAVRVLLPTVKRAHRTYLAPIGAYVGVIAALVLASVLGGHWAAPAGAAVFAVSDSVLASNKFVRPSTWAPLIVMATYHTALLLLVVSLGV